MKLTDMAYNKQKAYQSLQEAYDAIKNELTLEELSGKKLISIGIGIDSDGVKWYAIGHENEFTNCYIEDLQNLDWFEKGWIETPAPDYEYNFTDREELDYWLEQREDDMDDHYYYGFIENFEGEYYSVADIKKTSEDCPCSEDNPYTIYEWA